MRQCVLAGTGGPGALPLAVTAGVDSRGGSGTAGSAVSADERPRPQAAAPQREPARPTAPPPAVDWQDDATLAALAIADADAFGQLYDRYCDQIYRFAYRRLRDRESAEDATADVFFKALRAIGSYKPSMAPFSAWLYRIASNAVTDHLRARRPANSLDTAMETPDRSDPVDVQAINRLEADRVWLAVDRLTDAQRTAIILRLGHDLPIAEIAALMDRSEGAVKLLLNRGLTAVRTHLSDAPSGAVHHSSGPSAERGIQ
ncbi:MAG TPA: sigma-70 family RNA polymerase sigma factor [Kineosporiaceae bacterium]|nr:sigma-70 family RNA polymerase sigma factor [Kineosporiaceae bacterium]